MKSLFELQNQYYEEFKGTSIVRNNTPNDAFELVVLKVLYGKLLPDFTRENVSVFSEYVIAPPDDGIDIFFQHENGDDSSFDVIQVKASSLNESQLKACIVGMERTIDDFCKRPKTITSDSCKTILSNSNLEKSNKSRCTYYVIHTGTVDDFAGSEDNEKIITLKALNVIYNNISEYIDKDVIRISEKMIHGAQGDIVCSLNGIDLAELCNTYYSTDIGRNILFGSNLRESLITKKSKPYLSMYDTICNCPENFWYYNNGITIIAKDISPRNDDILELVGFSIVNGAQTTSALGLFLREAKKNNDITKIDQLKKVSVLTRILRVPDMKMREDIAIFNNSQSPITSRDMVANRPEQKHLYNWLMDDTYAQIYCEIRRGSQIPNSFNKYFTHRKTTNEELAQIVYAAFMQEPFIAKDKKSALFNNDYSSDYAINKIYHDVFYWDELDPSKSGLVFLKSKREIDEALFVQQLYKEAKRKRKKADREKIEHFQQEIDKGIDINKNEQRITTYSLRKDAAGICMFYFLALYYEFKAQFPNSNDKTFKYSLYYSDKAFKNQLIDEAISIFLDRTVTILIKTAAENGKSGNVNNWVRSANCQSAFLSFLREDIASDFELESKYEDFCEKFKYLE